MINIKDHLSGKKYLSKIILKTQEIKLGDTPESISLESIQIDEESTNPLEIGFEILGDTKADEMIKHEQAKEDST